MVTAHAQGGGGGSGPIKGALIHEQEPDMSVCKSDMYVRPPQVNLKPDILN